MRISAIVPVLVSLFIAGQLRAQEVNIIPTPVSVTAGTGQFIIRGTTPIEVGDAADRKTAEFFNAYLRSIWGFSLPIVGVNSAKPGTKKTGVKPTTQKASNTTVKQSTSKTGSIRFVTRKFVKAPEKDAYHFSSDANGIVIEGDTYPGTFYGMQTLIQLLPVEVPKGRLQELPVPAMTIEDAPRFDYRGMMLDVGRNFHDINVVKRFIDYLAMHKLNYFHWHLTDDQGWRVEIKKYPRLTSVGAYRNGTIIGRYPGKGNDNIRKGGFFTQEQIKDVVKYAGDRYITVIPEIEMPGHGSAAIAAYPPLSCFPDTPTIRYFPKACTWGGDSTGKQVQQTWGVFDDVFCAGKENTFAFLQDVIDEIVPLFPAKYIHVGGDECPKSNWKKCPECQKRMKAEGLKDEHELQSYFISRMEKYINGKGKQIIGWDEILEGGLAPNATVMSWRGEAGGIEAAKQHHPVIMSPTTYSYFDYTQTKQEDSVTIGGYLPLEKVYSYEPIPAELSEEEGRYIFGVQANLWDEYITNKRKIEYMVFPRMAALSEVTWSGKDKKNWPDFQRRLPVQFKRYDQWKANYSQAFYDLGATVIPTDNFEGVRWKLESKSGEPILVVMPGDTSTSPYKEPVLIAKNGSLGGGIRIAGRKIKIKQTFKFNKATGKKITLARPPSTKYPGDGGFTLVNGVQNETGQSLSNEFLGFKGADCELIIDFGATTSFREIVIHTFEQQGSYIYYPGGIDVWGSADGTSFSAFTAPVEIVKTSDRKKATIAYQSPQNTRYLKLLIRNNGIIKEGLPGAGQKAWLWLDEIEVN